MSLIDDKRVILFNSPSYYTAREQVAYMVVKTQLVK